MSPLPFRTQFIAEVGHGLFARLMLRPDITAMGSQAAIPIQRHEDPGATNLDRIEDQRTLLKGFHGRFHLAKPGVDLFGVFVLTRVFLFKCAILRKQLGMLCSFIRAERRRIANQTPQTVAVAVGQVDGHLDPLPTLSSNCLRLSLQFVRDQTVKQGRVLQPAAIIALEEIAQDNATRCLIGINTDKHCAPIRGPHRGLSQHAPDRIGLLVPGVLHCIPDLRLAHVIGVHREGHQLFQRHAILRIDVQKGRGHGGELQPLLHDLRSHEEGRRDGLFTLTLVAQGNKGAELIERMQGDALHVLSQGVVLGQNI